MENPDITVISPVYIDADTGELTVTFSRYLSRLCDYGAVIATDVFISEVKDMVWDSLVIEDSYAFLADQYGNIIIHTSRPDLLPRILDDGTLSIINLRDASIYNEFLYLDLEYSDIIPLHDHYNYKNWHFMSHYIAETGWVLFLATPESYVLGGVADLMTSAAIFWIPSITVITIIIWVVYMKLHNSNQRRRNYLDACPMYIELWDEHGNLLDVNQKAVNIFGLFDKEEYIRRNHEMTPKYQPCGTESSQKHKEIFSRLLDGIENTLQYEWMHNMLDSDELLPVEITLTRFRQDDKRMIIGYNHDLRPAKASAERQLKQEDQLRKVEKRSQFMLDVAPQVIQYWNVECVCVDCNQTALDFYGFATKAEYFKKLKSGKNWNDFLLRVFEEGTGNAEFTERSHSGALAYFKVEGLRTEYNNETVVITYSSDVTLSREKDRFQTMLDSSPSVIAMFDEKANVLDVNQAALEFYGFSSKQDYIDNFLETTPEFQPSGEASIPLMLDMFKKVIESGEKFVYHKWMHQSRNGEERPLELTLVPIQMDDKVCLIAHAIDLRDHFRLEAALSEASVANMAKSRFLAHMSHELRTPLNAILGLSQIELNFDDLSDRTATTFQKLCISGEELLGIVDDILDMSKIETGKMEIHCSEYDVPSLINDTISINIVRIGSKDINFVLDVTSALPCRLFGDSLRIKQILNNIISNAIKYTNAGQVKLSVSQETDDEDVTLCFIVEDTGQGLKPENLELLFSEYSRFNMEANHATQGTGLGLSITKQLVELMEGTITAESEYGKGSKFTITLKQKAIDSDIIDDELIAQLCDFTFLSNRNLDNRLGMRYAMPYGRVLVVDDVETNLQVATGLLTPYELQIDTSISGFDAIEKVREGNNYDIIFMDHMMPIMDGMETTRKLRDAEYDGVIVVLTANALVGNAEMFMQNGFDEFISKPIDVRQLDAILNKFVRGRHPEEAEKVILASSPSPADMALLVPAFKRDARAALDVIRETLAEGNIKLFTVTVHGMKSGLANMGEEESSALAEKLEEAGNSGDEAFIYANTEAFIEKLEALLETFTTEPADTSGEDIEEDAVFLEEQLNIIKAACEDYDDEAAYKAFDKLAQKPWKASTASFIDNIRSLLYSDSDFSGVVDEIDGRGN